MRNKNIQIGSIESAIKDNVKLLDDINIASTSSIGENNTKIEELNSQKSTLESELNSLNIEKRRLADDIGTINSEIESLTKALDISNSLTVTQQKLDETDKELNAVLGVGVNQEGGSNENDAENNGSNENDAENNGSNENDNNQLINVANNITSKAESVNSKIKILLQNLMDCKKEEAILVSAKNKLIEDINSDSSIPTVDDKNKEINLINNFFTESLTKLIAKKNSIQIHILTYRMRHQFLLHLRRYDGLH